MYQQQPQTVYAQQPVQQQQAAAAAPQIIPHRVEYREVMSRIDTRYLVVKRNLSPGQEEPSCWACCHAPEMCPCCRILPCCAKPEYIMNQLNASKYITLYENRLEWNDPIVTDKECSCTRFRVQDRVTVLYYDDPVLASVADRTRWCNDCKTYCCGGKGQRVRIEQTCCCGCCVRCPFGAVPVCVPDCCSPCTYSHDIFAENAADAAEAIKREIANKRNELNMKES